MATIITLYKKCKITRDRNARVDELANYLSSFSADDKKVFSDCQYQQIELNKILKLELDQAEVGKAVYNYLDIYQDEKHFYYFINKAVWKSTKTVEFELTMDTVNTFADDFTFNKKTHITRQHKDRLKKVGSWWPLDFVPLTYLSYNVTYAFRKPSDFEVLPSTIFSISQPSTPVELPRCYTYSVVTNDGETLRSYNAYNVKYGGGQGGYGLYINYAYMTTTIPIRVAYASLFVPQAQLETDASNGIYHCLTITEWAYNNGEIEDYDSLIFSSQRSNVFNRIVDEKSEEINPPLFKDGYEHKIEDTNTNFSANWYLVYKANSTDETSGLQCQLWPDREFEIQLKQTLNKAPTDFTSGNYYYIMPVDASHANISHKSRTFSHGNVNTAEYMEIIDNANGNVVGRIRNEPGDYHNDKGSYFCILYRDGTSLKIEEYMNKDNFWAQITTTKTNEYTITTGNTISFRYYEGSKVNYYTSASKETNLTNIWNNCKNGVYNQGEWTATTEWKTLTPFSSLDRTDSKLVRIIALPYVVNMRYYMFDSNTWSYDTDGSFLYLNNPNVKLNNILGVAYNPLADLQIQSVSAYDPAKGFIQAERDDSYESKFYNSEFYTPKFVYDSFNYQYQLENVDVDRVDFSGGQNIKYTCSSLINSRFMWQFDVPLKRSTSDYDNICIAARNNELPIYSNKYLDYIRSGYNYDVKNKQAQLTKGITTTTLATLGAGVGTALTIGAASGSAAGPVGTAIGAVVGAGVGLATSLVGLASSQAQADRNIQQKLDEAQRQATSVVGGDDVDLLDIYTDGNKAKYVTYRCSNNVKQAMADLFYYCGYNDDVREVPNLNTRLFFNFIQCEPVFNEENNTVYKEYLDDIKQRYREGVTVYHRASVYLTPEASVITLKYDWNQEYENVEESLKN